MKKIIKKAFKSLGYDIRRIKPGYSGWNASNIRSLAPEIKTCVDIGSGYGTKELYKAFPNVFHVLIDPLEEYEPYLTEILTKYKGQYFITAIGSNNTTLKISMEQNILVSSFQKRTELTSTGKETLETREVPVITLDNLLEKHKFQPPFGLKIDTEGFELEVIRGASDFLCHTEFVIAEVSYNKRFENGYRFQEFADKMKECGFYLCDVLKVVGKPTLFLDCMFKKIS